jgi:predicted alpha/beta hydrolase
MKEIIITAEDGYKLSALLAVPIDKCCGSIILSSATGIKKEFYINFTQFLVQKGYCVLLYDYRGIGESAPKDLKKSNSYMHEWGTKDMNAALNYMVNDMGFTNIVWVGHSVGAQLIGFLENRQHIKKVIAISAALGYWGYFHFPSKWLIWGLWYFIAPLMVKIYGYGAMRKIGWGENLPPNMLMEWRKWCLSKTYFMGLLKEKTGMDKFYYFTTPITAVYISDDHMANDITVPLMMQFFPNSPQEVLKVCVKKHTNEKVGHMGIFRKRFEMTLWPLLADVIVK